LQAGIQSRKFPPSPRRASHQGVCVGDGRGHPTPRTYEPDRDPQVTDDVDGPASTRPGPARPTPTMSMNMPFPSPSRVTPSSPSNVAANTSAACLATARSALRVHRPRSGPGVVSRDRLGPDIDSPWSGRAARRDRDRNSCGGLGVLASAPTLGRQGHIAR
jgi:hypothetical protein